VVLWFQRFYYVHMCTSSLPVSFSLYDDWRVQSMATVGCDTSSLQVDKRPKSMVWSKSRQPIGTVLHSSNELSECHGCATMTASCLLLLLLLLLSLLLFVTAEWFTSVRLQQKSVSGHTCFAHCGTLRPTAWDLRKLRWQLLISVKWELTRK